MKLAIVGSHKHINHLSKAMAQGIIEVALAIHQPIRVISGGADGIDTLAKEVATDRGIPVDEYKPEKPKWYWYKKRNKRIAEECDVLVCIRHSKSRTHGSQWTADYAESLGKKVFRFEID